MKWLPSTVMVTLNWGNAIMIINIIMEVSMSIKLEVAIAVTISMALAIGAKKNSQK